MGERATGRASPLRDSHPHMGKTPEDGVGEQVSSSGPSCRKPVFWGSLGLLAKLWGNEALLARVTVQPGPRGGPSHGATLIRVAGFQGVSGKSPFSAGLTTALTSLTPQSLSSRCGTGRLGNFRLRLSSCGSDGKESACSSGDLGLILVLGGSPGKVNSRLPAPVFWPGEFHGERSRADNNPWGHKESDPTERLPLTPLSRSLFRPDPVSAVGCEQDPQLWLEGRLWKDT